MPSRSRGLRGVFTRGLATGKYSSSRNASHASGGHGPAPKRMATSISSRSKSARVTVASTFTSIFGCASMKRMRRGISQPVAKEGSTLTVRRLSRRVGRSCSAACAISSSALRTRSAKSRPAAVSATRLP